MKVWILREKWGWFWACACLLAACGRPAPASPTPEPEPTRVESPAPPASPTPPPAVPTLTPEPLAALVNGQAVTLAAYEREVARCQAGLTGAGLDPGSCPAAVLDSLIEQAVVEQAAASAGLSVAEAEVDAALARAAAGIGGPEAFAAWLAANLYAEEEFRDALRRDLLRARLAAQAVAAVDGPAEQVHAQALLVADEATAQALLDQLRAGADFATLAVAHSIDLSSRAAGGDLGWFPRGLLTVPEVEQAAFALQPGELSAVIQSALGYHIVQTLERDPARPLSPGAEQALRARAYDAWLDQLMSQASVERLVNP